MLGILYARNKRTNKNIATFITAIVGLSQFVALPSITVPGINMPLIQLLSGAGMLWVAFGLWKRKLAQ